MLMRSFSLIWVILSLTSCAHWHKTTKAPQTYQKPSYATQTRTTGPFTRVLVDGNIDVNLYTGDHNPRVILHGDSRGLSDVEISVKDGLLHVNEGKGYPHFGRVRADIRTHYLTSVAYRGTGAVVGNNIQSSKLDISLHNTGKTTLQGKIALNKLDVNKSGDTRISGITPSHSCQIKIAGKSHVQLAGVMDVASLYMKDDGWLSLYWVQSNELKIRARDKAFIQMAGITKVLDIELWDNAHFNGRYLRGTRVFAKTHHNAIADISVVKHQHTLARDSSNIYFYNLPNTKADFMVNDGSVLDMREWESPSLREYTHYNR